MDAECHKALKIMRVGGWDFMRSALLRAAGVLCVLALLPMFLPEARAHQDLLARIALLTEQIRTNGSSAELLVQRADLYRNHQDWVPALWDYDAAEKASTNSAVVDLGRALTLAGLGKWVEARDVFDRVVQDNPTNAAALLGRARVLVQLDQPALAIADYERAFTNLASPHPEDYLERARLQAAQSDPAAAVKGLDEALARLGWMVTLQLQAMDYEQACGNYDGALTRLETIISRSNRSEGWLQLKGEILQKAGQTADARAAFHAALKAIDDLPPRFARSENMIKLRTQIEASLASLGTAIRFTSP